jgi:signal peptidase I
MNEEKKEPETNQAQSDPLKDRNDNLQETAETQDDTQSAENKKKLTYIKVMKELIVCSAQVIILTMLIINFIGRVSVVQGQSMYPSLTTNNRIVINLLAYRFHQPKRGEIIVFRCPSNPERDYIKRVIALPGEEISIRDGKVFINHNLLNEPYILRNFPDENISRIKLGENQIFVMGDNRCNSEDSRTWGALDEKFIRGKAELIFWPPEALNICK